MHLAKWHTVFHDTKMFIALISAKIIEESCHPSYNNSGLGSGQIDSAGKLQLKVKETCFDQFSHEEIEINLFGSCNNAAS